MEKASLLGPKTETWDSQALPRPLRALGDLETQERARPSQTAPAQAQKSFPVCCQLFELPKVSGAFSQTRLKKTTLQWKRGSEAPFSSLTMHPVAWTQTVRLRPLKTPLWEEERNRLKTGAKCL